MRVDSRALTRVVGPNLSTHSASGSCSSTSSSAAVRELGQLATAMRPGSFDSLRSSTSTCLALPFPLLLVEGTGGGGMELEGGLGAKELMAN
jgi:hypothetical protein